ncbi:MAG: hypothetical protein CL775_04085 [Chloroflexi bacterium]|nr:hypothetical protein [Chloroflexota bacterium]|tara:strand:- start:5629 stop:6828 length:1200 start_codon:yes stop_codon:yes gene_type:complete
MDAKLDNISNLGIYVHIPFCHTKCTYCDFNTYTGIENSINDFSQALYQEIEFWSITNSNYIVNSIFIGGGTPSYIDQRIINNIIEHIKGNFNLHNKSEITIEINPEDVTHHKALLWEKSGINRSSIGIQSLDDKELKIINRRHNANTAINSLKTLQSIFDNCSVDIIYGLPNQSINSYTNTLNKLIDEQPDHFSSYSLQVERGTLLEKQVTNKNLEVAGDELSATMYEKTMKVLKENGYEQYEISNWSLKGKRSLHNMKYWKLDPYIGIGPGAHSYINNKRFSIVKSPKRYIDFFGQKQNKKSINEKIEYLNNNGMLDLYENQTKKNHIIEYLMLRLRLSDGISKKEFSEYFGIDFDNSYYNKIKKYIENEILIKNSDRYYLSEKGKLFANEVAESFVE